MPVFSISTNQAMVFEGGRRPGWLPFCIATGQERSLVRGEEVSSHSLHGFRSDLQDSFFQLQNGSQLQVGCRGLAWNNWLWPAESIACLT